LGCTKSDGDEGIEAFDIDHPHAWERLRTAVVAGGIARLRQWNSKAKDVAVAAAFHTVDSQDVKMLKDAVAAGATADSALHTDGDR